jgi:glucose/mannose-6-phosphate isomerase
MVVFVTIAYNNRKYKGDKMLDDLKYIHQKDAQDALGVVEKQYQQLDASFRVDVSSIGEVKNVVLAGMGGSALAAGIVKAWPKLNVPFEIVRDYELPHYVNEQTLFIASSYSGNTEETLAALGAAEEMRAQIIVICAGGKLAEIAKNKNYPLYILPPNYQPRMAVLLNFKALIEAFSGVGLIDAASSKEIEKATQLMQDVANSWRADIPTKDNLAKRIALDLVGKSPVIYSGPLLAPVTYKWKININENAKNVAWCNQYPEFNHNEFLGWSSHPVDKPYAVVNLRSSFDSVQIQKRFDISKKLLGGRMPDPLEVHAEGATQAEQLFYSLMLGDFVSVYLAILNGLNPTPVELIEKLKAELA